ncbi:MAG: bifunctional riboflavin kinase/FAD synthetase [Oscillospiraceae bacterium]|nr:bifunctional riboflavin kinase/FAD synthetase [Oscillospiraceae bacterium]
MNTTPRRVIALGFFDGVHNGHGALLRRVIRRAAERNASPAAFTFDIHPESLIFGRTTPILTDLPLRRELMAQLYGIHDVIVAHYDHELMRTPWKTFVTDYLISKCGAVHLVVGHDFRFGYRGEGNPQRLESLCRELGIGCDIIQPVVQDGITVSSTYIRTLVAQGETERAQVFLGHPHSLSGTVTHGKKLGRTLGFPTVNLTFPESVLIPAHGVYATRVTVDGSTYNAVTNVGVRPTVDAHGDVTAETFLLDFDGDLYGKTLRLDFYQFLRPEQKFADHETLCHAIRDSAQQARAYFRSADN